MIIKEVLKKGIEYLKDSEYTNPFMETRYILAQILGKNLAYLISHENNSLDKSVEEKYFNILQKRQAGEPIQYLLGQVEFYGRDFFVDKGVLIPRNDTEVSVEALKKIFQMKKVKNFLEIGSGTGIVSISMAIENPQTSFLACDISQKAIKNTRKNIDKYKLKNIDIIYSDIYSNIKDKYDIIYSNPPYIRREEIKNLQIEVKNHEPIRALDGGLDGLDFYKQIIKNFEKYTHKDSFLVLEIGYDQANDIISLLNGYNKGVIQDLSNKDRVIVASKGEFNVREFKSI